MFNLTDHRKTTGWFFAVTMLFWGCPAMATDSEVEEEKTARSHLGKLDDGAAWTAKIPANWNGTLLLYAHGFDFELSPPETAPKGMESELLEAGYALAASQYPTAGWAVEQAVPSQLIALHAFKKRFGEPERTIAWGSSMGGLVTTALAEQYGQQIDGAISMCASGMGALPMMNMALDGAFTIITLIPPENSFNITGSGNNFAAVKQVIEVMETARASARQGESGVGRSDGWLARLDAARRPGFTPFTCRRTGKAYCRGDDERCISAQRRSGASCRWCIFLERRD